MNRSTECSLITRRRSGQRIWYDGRNWTEERSTTKEPATEDHQSPINLVKVGRFIVGHGIKLFRLAKEKGLEGIIAKRAASTYQPRRRSPDRLKINARLKKKFVIGDITEGKESRKQIGALLLGVYE